MAHVAVVGAGVVGASVALQAQSALPPGSSVTLIADGFNDATTSWVAAGAFRVESLADVSPLDPSRGGRWCRDSLEHYARLAFSPAGPQSGVMALPLVQVAYERPSQPYAYGDFVPGGFQELTPDELAVQFPDWPGLGYGVACLSVLADPNLYLPWLLASFVSAGGRIQHRRLSSLEEAGIGCDLVFNCAGLGAAQLAGGDPAVHPVRGQVIRVRAPWLKQAVYGPDSTYVFPSAAPSGLATVGGVRQAGDTRMAPRDADTDDIRRRAVRLLPRLASHEAWTVDGSPARVVVGLRPARTGGVRVEAEGRAVHCYGHGAHGISMSWGTAKDAVRLGVARLAKDGRLGSGAASARL